MRFCDTEFPARLLKLGSPGHIYFGVTEQTARDIYNFTKVLWCKRQLESPEAIEESVVSYRRSLYKETCALALQKMLEIYADRDSARPFSVIDFGGASGSLCYFLKEQFPDDPIRYVLVDAFPGFVDDFKNNFPDQHAVLADAEKFPELDDEAFGETPVDVFFASHVLYLLMPSVVKGILKRASRLTDNFVLLDNIENFEGQLDKENPVVYDYLSRAGQVYFSHFHKDYLDDIGFEAVDLKPCDIERFESKQRVPGYGVFHARRGR